MSAQKCILLVPGVGDRNWLYNLALPHWQQKDIATITHTMPWNIYEPYEKKFTRLLQKIDRLYEQYGPLSLIGVSASGSSGLHAFLERRKKIDKFIAVSAWLTNVRQVFPPLDVITFNYPDYKEAILAVQPFLPSLSYTDKKRILSFHGKLDLIIPPSTSEIDGTTTIVTPTYSHGINSLYPIFFGRQQIHSFLFDEPAKSIFSSYAFS